jgi:hypothetical protein
MLSAFTVNERAVDLDDLPLSRERIAAALLAG